MPMGHRLLAQVMPYGAHGLLVHATRLLHMIQESLVPTFKREGKK
jgi:hypothetical protein